MKDMSNLVVLRRHKRPPRSRNMSLAGQRVAIASLLLLCVAFWAEVFRLFF
jgi:hypothetical protein